MAETCAIDFLTLVSYSTSTVILGLRRLLLPFLIRAGSDFSWILRKIDKVRFSCTYIQNGQICTDQTILSALINNMRLKKFFVFGLRKFSRKIDEVQILIIVVHFLTARYKEIWTVTAIIFGSLTESPAYYANVLKDCLTLIRINDRWRCKCATRAHFRRRAILEFFSKFDRPWNKH